MSKFKNTFIDNPGDLDIVIPMHCMLESSDNSSMISGSLWNCYRGEVNDDWNENNAVYNRINNNKTITK